MRRGGSVPDVPSIPTSAQSARDQRICTWQIESAPSVTPLGENEPMACSTPPPALPEDERRAAEALLTRTLGEPAEVQSAEPLLESGACFPAAPGVRPRRDTQAQAQGVANRRAAFRR